MRLFDRSKELQILNEAFTESTRRSGRLVIVTGGPGSGKTQLLHEFLAAPDRSGARILQATALPAERDRPMSLLRQLLRNGEVQPVPLNPARPAGGQKKAFSRHLELRSRTGFGDPEPGTTEALLRLADGERPLVVAVDDAHLMDEASLGAVLHLLSRSRSRPVLVVCATSAPPGAGGSAAHAELIRRPHRRARLGPLSERAVGELIAAQSQAARPPGLVGRAFHRATAGNPLLVHALLDDSSRFGRDIDRPIASTAYRQAVLSLVHRGEPRHVRVVQALAAFGAPASPAVLADLADTTPAGVEEAVEALDSAGLLDGHVFRLPAAATAVLDDMDTAARAALHGRVADLLHRCGAPAGEMARHLHAAQRVPRPWGPAVLRAAAEQALAADDVELCGSYLNLILRDCTDMQERNALSAALARAEWRVNPAAAGAHLEPLRGPALDGALSMRDTATVLRHMLWQGDTELAAETVATLVPARSPGDAQILAEVEFVRQWFYGVALPARSLRGAGADPRRPAPADRNGGLAEQVAVLVGGVATDDSAAAVAQALQGRKLDHLNLELVAMALLAIAHADRPGVAAEACDALLESAVERRATTWQALLGSVRAEIALLRGDMTRAAEGADRALSSLHDGSWGVLAGLPLSTAIFAHTAMGAYDEAERVLRRDVPEPMFHTVFGIQYLRARGHHYLVTDRPFAALNDFETCSRLMRQGNSSLQKGIPWRSDLALANLRIGKAHTARECAEEQLRLPGGHSSRARAMALRMLAATSKPHRRASLLREAIDLLKLCGDQHTLAQAYADLSAAHYELGEYARARLVARQAAREAKACSVDSPVDAHLLEDPGQSEGSEAEGPAILSDAECRVAGLAALGYTNREISGRLHVTISTVEQHLTRVYRKLNVASRSELPPKMLEHRIPKLSDRWATTYSSAG
ncbi:helix-turn-helix transcriptional regulator [Streptomyces salyersiae]|uniref:AAA family ATPase n=1 Tax=Streptomyces salyersiae TaxID=3075530 RepID=A0ABU2RDW6_9ACTN|nr:AAA family ATPase [Streptomyces sp. DSM 41770]MDT0427040.1 AAA family ATPase [Streptomyces sp. DSM 41770]